MEATQISINRWMGRESALHTRRGMLLIYKKECSWVGSSEVDELRAYYTEWSKSQREKQISYVNAYIWNLERWHWWTYLQGISGDRDTKNRLVDAVGKGEGGTNWKRSIEMSLLPYVKEMTSGNLLYDTGSRNPVLRDSPHRWDGEGRGREVWTYVYQWLVHVDVWQRPTQYCKAITLQLKINSFLKC